jgi:hypothetical protein
MEHRDKITFFSLPGIKRKRLWGGKNNMRSMTEERTPEDSGAFKKKILVAGIVIVCILVAGAAGAVYLWNHQDWNKYCTEKVPGSTYNSTSNTCEISGSPVQADPIISIDTSPLSGDEKFIAESSQTSGEMESALIIMISATDMFEERTNEISMAESNYKNAVQLLNDEQEVKQSLTTRYIKAVESASEPSTVRYLTTYYQSLTSEENDLINKYNQDVQKYNTARKAAAKPINFTEKGIDIGVLSNTSQKNIDDLSALRVSPDLQPMKDQYLAALVNFKKGGDAFVLAVNSYNTGNISGSSKYIDQYSAYIETGKNQIQATTLKLREYENKLS